MWLVFVIVFWILVFALMMFLVRWTARAVDDEQTVCDITDEHYAPPQGSQTSPTAPAT